MIEFIRPLYNWLQQFTNHYLRLDTLDFWPQFTTPLHRYTASRQSHIATDGLSVSKSWCRAPSEAHNQIFITVWQLQPCFCGALSLTGGRVCLLYILLALAIAVYLVSEFLGTRDHILLSHIRDFPFRRLLRLRATVEVFDPASTRDFCYVIHKNSVRTSQET
jgi:hypothetical protein